MDAWMQLFQKIGTLVHLFLRSVLLTDSFTALMETLEII